MPPSDTDADASTTLIAVGGVTDKAIAADADASTTVTADAVAEIPTDALAANCVVSGSPKRPLPNKPVSYVERKPISLP
jgi:hypothetical protein